jgi:1-acyl-sn-glycerol-3-phosphate acyltransferase
VTRARFLRAAFNFLLGLFTRRHITGLENVPACGPYIVAANHLSTLDAALVYGLLGGPEMKGWAAEKWERNLVFGSILRLGGSYFIQRGQVDRDAFDFAVEWLRAGHVFGMAPEGTRSHTGGLLQGKTGIAYIAQQSGAPIVPMAHSGTDRALRFWPRLRRLPIDIRIGRTFSLPPVDTNDRSASLRRNADEVMCRLAALLPQSYRGVYADHPRLKELLASGDF